MYSEVMKEGGDTQYQCTITLPISCPVIEPILVRINLVLVWVIMHSDMAFLVNYLAKLASQHTNVLC